MFLLMKLRPTEGEPVCVSLLFVSAAKYSLPSCCVMKVFNVLYVLVQLKHKVLTAAVSPKQRGRFVDLVKDKE